MALNFVNLYHSKIWIAFIWADGSCGSKYKKKGWWAVDPGQARNIWNVNLQKVGRYAYFYAEEFQNGGGATWNGTGNRWYMIRGDGGFEQCLEDNIGCNQQPNFVDIDFDEADNGHHPFNGMSIVLGPPPGQIQKTGSVIIDEP